MNKYTRLCEEMKYLYKSLEDNKNQYEKEQVINKKINDVKNELKKLKFKDVLLTKMAKNERNNSIF